jgi:malate dehydrogenase (quinone)
MAKEYDVIIVGGGIIGSALLYTISTYTDVKSVLLLEKYKDVALLNSNSASNSQTLHWGDVETNYSIEKARDTKEASERVLKFTSKLPKSERDLDIQACQKMVLGVGDFEVGRVESIFTDKFRELFPGAKKIGKDELERIEPNVMKGRDPKEKVQAILSDAGYMVNFNALAHSLVKRAAENKDVKIDVMFNSNVTKIVERESDNSVFVNGDEYKARFVDVAAGTYSLFFAREMGYASNLSALEVGGNFYWSPKVLNGKVYRVQIGGIPFAAVHGDPDITNPNITRFGPTVSMAMRLERYNPGTRMAFMKTIEFDSATLASFKKIFLGDSDVRRILKNNLVYMMPVVGKEQFLKNEVQSIVPSLKGSELHFAKGVGGIRPQVVDEKKMSLVLGESKIPGRHNLIFNVTPSPGATSCLSIALEDAIKVAKLLDVEFKKDKYEKELGPIRSK